MDADPVPLPQCKVASADVHEVRVRKCNGHAPAWTEDVMERIERPS